MSAIGTSGLFIVVVERRLAERSGQFRLVNDWGVSLDKSRLIRLHQQMKEGIAVSFAGTGVHNNKAKASTFGSTPPRLQAFIGGPSNGPWARYMLSQKEDACMWNGFCCLGHRYQIAAVPGIHKLSAL